MWLPLQLAVNDLRRRRSRVALSVFTLAFALASYTLLGCIIGEMRYQAGQMWRQHHPYDAFVQVSRANAELSRVKALTGVAIAEAALTVDVVMSYGPTPVMVVDRASRILTYELESGELPAAADEVALPASLARSSRVGAGDMINVLPAGATASTARIQMEVSGLLSDKLGVPRLPVVSLEGATKLGLTNPEPNVLLVVLDGRVEPAAALKQLESALPAAKVTVYREQYERAASNMSIADTMAAALRLLLLAVTSAAVAALFHLAERERAYETGVLRAMGMRIATLLARAGLGAAAVVVVGCIGGVGLAWAAAGLLDVPIAQLRQGVAADILVFAAVAMGVTLVTSGGFAGRGIGSLLRDAWGKG
jgi:hypothetical protein